jgi:hypothetical protein
MNKPNPWITFWPAWVLVNTIGWMVLTIAFITPFCGQVAAVLFGLLIGLLQWKVLYRYIGVDDMWMWASTLPYGLLFLIITLLGKTPAFAILLPAESVILCVLGLTQTSILRNYTNFALILIAASPVAGLVGTLLSWVITWILFPHGGYPLAVFWGLVGFFYGCLTGITLILLENLMVDEL